MTFKYYSENIKKYNHFFLYIENNNIIKDMSISVLFINIYSLEIHSEK